ncbi:MAG: hypothetical protein ACRDSJ_19240 [Rubrobacteraceae bacterium]
MKVRIAKRAAWTVWGLSVASVLAGTVLYVINASTPGGASEASVFEPAVAVVIPTFGAIIATRHPFHPIAWIFLCTSSLGLVFLCGEYATFALRGDAASPPGGVWAAWVVMWAWSPGIFALNLLLPLLYPTGRLPSRRWRPVFYLIIILFVLSLLFAAVPGPNPEFPSVENPTGVPGFGDVIGSAGVVFGVAFLPLTLVCLSAPLARFRRATGEERQQIKWFVYFAALLAAFLVASALGILSGIVSDVLNVAMIVCGSAAIGVAILKYRLYDIDFIINKTLVYGLLTGTLVLVYLGGVVGLQYLIRALTGGESQLAVVASTLVVAALFNPLRRRIQNFIDRRFYRKKYDAARTLEAFSAKARNETSLDSLSENLTTVVEDTLRPSHASLWLRPGDDSDRRAGLSTPASPRPGDPGTPHSPPDSR